MSDDRYYKMVAMLRAKLATISPLLFNAEQRTEMVAMLDTLEQMARERDQWRADVERVLRDFDVRINNLEKGASLYG